jgi:hypothetical protein
MSLVAASRSSDSSRSRVNSSTFRTSFASAFFREARRGFDGGFLVCGIVTLQRANPKHQIRNKRSQKHLKFGKSKTRNPKETRFEFGAHFVI